MAFHRGPDLKPAARELRRLGYSWKQVSEALIHISVMGTVEDCSLLAPDDRLAVEAKIPDSGFWTWREFNKPIEMIGFTVPSGN